MKISTIAFAAFLSLSFTNSALAATSPAGTSPEAVTVITTKLHHHADGTVGVEQSSKHFGPANHASNALAENATLFSLSSVTGAIKDAGKKVVEAGKAVGGAALDVAKAVGGAALDVGKKVGGAAVDFVVSNPDMVADVAKAGAGLAFAAATGGKAGAKEHVAGMLGGKKAANEE